MNPINKDIMNTNAFLCFICFENFICLFFVILIPASIIPIADKVKRYSEGVIFERKLPAIMPVNAKATRRKAYFGLTWLFL